MHSAKHEICTALCDYTHSAEYHDGVAKSNHTFKLVARSQIHAEGTCSQYWASITILCLV